MKLAMQIISGGDTLKALETAAGRVKGALRNGVRKAALVVEREAKRIVYAGRPDHLQGDKGGLRRSITHEMDPDGLSAVIGPNVVYAAVHEFGAVIKAKRAPYLVFQVQNLVQTTRKTKGGETVPTVGREAGRWVSVKQVTIPARPYMGPAIDAKRGEVADTILQAVYEVIL